MPRLERCEINASKALIDDEFAKPFSVPCVRTLFVTEHTSRILLPGRVLRYNHRPCHRCNHPGTFAMTREGNGKFTNVGRMIRDRICVPRFCVCSDTVRSYIGSGPAWVVMYDGYGAIIWAAGGLSPCTRLGRKVWLVLNVQLWLRVICYSAILDLR